MIPTALLHHAVYHLHDMGDDHPESPLRLDAILNQLEASGLSQKMDHREAPLASKEAVLRVHHPIYVEQLERVSPSHGLIQADPDTLMGPYTWEASYRAAGAGIQAVDDIMAGHYQRAFCAVRPPGHHAEPAATMGFCFFNNIAVAAQHARQHHGLKRVAIIDFDVHQCNGTIEAFTDEPDVLVCSSFQYPFYPNTHWQSEHPHIILTPQVAFATIDDVKDDWEARWKPALQAHQPEMIFISAGFDAHTLDPMGQLNWQTEDYYWITRVIMEQAEQLCSGRVVSMLEGGYHLKALAASAEQHIRAMMGLGAKD
ncbi:MAG TPA: histone deacetylase family protein [Saccharospirillum sp.]|nr:histone deacetylase family protein [Saccharospirillum sp.]